MSISPRVNSAPLAPAQAMPTTGFPAADGTVAADGTIARVWSGAFDSTALIELINQETL